MANKLLQKMFCNWHKPVVIAGSFAPNNTSAVDNTANRGADFTVARTGTGEFTVTLANNLALSEVEAMVATAQLSTAADIVAQITAITPAAANRTYVITLNAGATATDVAAAAGNRVNFVIFGKNTTVPK